MLLDGRAPADRRPAASGAEATMLIVFNSWHDGVGFELPHTPGGTGWTLLIDTNQPDLTEEPAFKAGNLYEVTGRSVLLFVMAK